MEKVKKGSLKRQFFTAVAVTLLLVALASALTVFGCWQFQRWLVPRSGKLLLRARYTGPYGWIEDENLYVDIDGGEVRVSVPLKQQPDKTFKDEERLITSYTFSVKSVGYSIYQNGPRRGMAYIAAGAAMGFLPAVYAVAGAFFCALWFYRRKISPAIAVLDGAARHIGGQDLDFTVECPLDNELGRLCLSFEGMRRALYESNLRLWRTLEERRTLRASVAHDLRNPLAIIKGLLENMRQACRTGALTGGALEASLDGLEAAAGRMERYADYIRDLDAVEDTEVDETEVALPDFLGKALENIGVLARGLEIAPSIDVPECKIGLDTQIFYRVFENVFSNAARYAMTRICVQFSLRDGMLRVKITDDGPGFSETVLKRRDSLYYTEDRAGGHRGLGLAAGRILCEKHGGELRLANGPSGGASVEFTLAVKM